MCPLLQVLYKVSNKGKTVVLWLKIIDFIALRIFDLMKILILSMAIIILILFNSVEFIFL